MRPVLFDLRPQLQHVLAARCVGEDDRWLPLAVAVERKDRAHLVQHRLRRGVIHLVDRDHVRDLHDPGLQRLDGISRARHQHEDDRVRDPDHLDLALSCTHRLEEDEILPRRIEHEQRLQRRLRQPSKMATRTHRADEDSGVEEVIRETDAISQQRALRERARGIDGDHPHRPLLQADVADKLGDERGLADTGWPGHSDGVRATCVRVDVPDELVGEWVGVLDERDRACERTRVTRADAFRERFPRPIPPRRRH